MWFISSIHAARRSAGDVWGIICTSLGKKSIVTPSSLITYFGVQLCRICVESSNRK